MSGGGARVDANFWTDPESTQDISQMPPQGEAGAEASSGVETGAAPGRGQRGRRGGGVPGHQVSIPEKSREADGLRPD